MPHTKPTTSYGWVLSDLKDLSEDLRRVALETSQKAAGGALFHQTRQDITCIHHVGLVLLCTCAPWAEIYGGCCAQKTFGSPIPCQLSEDDLHRALLIVDFHRGLTTNK